MAVASWKQMLMEPLRCAGAISERYRGHACHKAHSFLPVLIPNNSCHLCVVQILLQIASHLVHGHGCVQHRQTGTMHGIHKVSNPGAQGSPGVW